MRHSSAFSFTFSNFFFFFFGLPSLHHLSSSLEHFSSPPIDFPIDLISKSKRPGITVAPEYQSRTVESSLARTLDRTSAMTSGFMRGLPGKALRYRSNSIRKKGGRTRRARQKPRRRRYPACPKWMEWGV